jgi:formate hydrogenlyase transcriptional activator
MTLGSTSIDGSVSGRSVVVEILDSIAAHPEMSSLMHDLLVRFGKGLKFDLLTLSLQDAADQPLRLCIVESRNPITLSLPCEISASSSAAGRALSSHQPVIIETRELRDSTGLLKEIYASGFQSYCAIPVMSPGGRRCALGFGRTEMHRFSDEELTMMQDIALETGFAVDTFLLRQANQIAENEVEVERDRLKTLLEISSMLAGTRDLHQLFQGISTSIRHLFRHDYAGLILVNSNRRTLRLEALDLNDSKGLIHEDIEMEVEATPAGRVISTKQPLLVNQLEKDKFPSHITEWLLAEGIRSACWLPLIGNDRVHGVFTVGSRQEAGFLREDLPILTQVANLLAIAVENVVEFEQIVELKERLLKEKRYLEHEIREQYNADEIVGASPPWLRVLEQVESVASTTATVLLQGETGTGKEIIARALHERSDRKDHAFVKLSCATIPAGLLESELFGHEKGAFTGAIAQHIGRFEAANLGTLFLDEIGELPLELQPKLLRALQEQTFERLGSNRPIRVDVRVIAATNRDLRQLVAEQKFRADLFYRISVFPLSLPALRERRDDIPLLVSYFVQKHSDRLKRNIQTIPDIVMQALVNWKWPGNVRELENFIERSVILSTTSTLQAPLTELSGELSAMRDQSMVRTMEEAERDAIVRALQQSRGLIDGPSGAAALLGMKRTTLNSRMLKLGIKRSDF